MNLLTGKEAATRVQGILHPKYQVHGHAVDLTVRQIFTLNPTGQVDFGGSEYVAAVPFPVGTTPRHPEDRDAWWDLARGGYSVEFNESLELTDDEIALLEPHERLLRAGASHASVFLRGHVAPVHTLLHVDVLSLSIKQNARISRVLIFRLGSAIESTPRATAARPAKARKSSHRKSSKK